MSFIPNFHNRADYEGQIYELCAAIGAQEVIAIASSYNFQSPRNMEMMRLASANGLPSREAYMSQLRAKQQMQQPRSEHKPNVFGNIMPSIPLEPTLEEREERLRVEQAVVIDQHNKTTRILEKLRIITNGLLKGFGAFNKDQK